MSDQQTFCMIKPGVRERALIGEIISRIERSGLEIDGLKMMTISEATCSEHYQEHREKPFYHDLVSYMTSGPVVAMVARGVDAISHVRRLAGATNPANATPGTIRGDFALETQANIIHASDSPESAAREIKLFFDTSELVGSQ